MLLFIPKNIRSLLRNGIIKTEVKLCKHEISGALKSFGNMLEELNGEHASKLCKKLLN